MIDDSSKLFKVLPLLIFLVCLTITVIVFSYLKQAANIQNEQYFDKLVGETQDAIHARLMLYEQSLWGGIGLFKASNFVDRSEWRQFTDVQRIDQTLPGINGIGFIEYVTKDGLDEFLEKTRSDNVPEFKNKPNTSFKNKFIIKYIEPVERNKNALGLDIGFEQNRRQAAEKALETGKFSLTRKIWLVQDEKKRAGFLLLMPLYKDDLPNNTIEEKYQSIIGWVHATFIGEMFFSNINPRPGNEIAFAVFEGAEKNEESLIHKDENYERASKDYRFERQTTIDMAGQEWTIIWYDTNEFVLQTPHAFPGIALIVGIIISFLLSFLTFVMNNRTTVIKEIVEKQTFDLAEERRAFKTGQSRTNETIKIHDGTEISIDTLKVRFEDMNDKKYILGIGRDISELQKANENLEHIVEERTKELKKASEAKDTFLANMSHELRTPLNSIIGLVAIMVQEKNLSSDHIKTLRIVDKSSSSLLEIVNDILDISKIEAGKFELENAPFNISDVTHSTLDQLKPLASKKGLVLKSNDQSLADINLIGDKFLLSRILLNLISNAIKYTQEGYVDVETVLENVKGEKVKYTCTVTDTGIGISEDKLPIIFDKFTQAEETTERRYGGTGLGLNITRHLVMLMGGDVTVESEYGKGSSFTVSIMFKKSKVLPQQKTETVKKARNRKNSKKVPMNDARILVAEDHGFNQIFIMKLLSHLGAKNVELVTDGMEAFTAYQDNEYDLILMDCHMPQMNGYEVTKAVREEEKNQESPKHGTRALIIAMTADAMVGTKEKCLEAGMDYYISKPIIEEEFRELIKEWFVLDNPSPREADNVSIKQVAPANLTILKEYSEGDPKVEAELLVTFYDKASNDIKTLNENTKAGENKVWVAAAHSLKGSVAYIGADHLYSLCVEAQDMLQAKSKDRKAILKEIKEEYKKVCSFLKKRA